MMCRVGPGGVVRDLRVLLQAATRKCRSKHKWRKLALLDVESGVAVAATIHPLFVVKTYQQAHRVTPLVSGRRRVMAMELWHQRGAERPANARPHKPYGQCPA